MPAHDSVTAPAAAARVGWLKRLRRALGLLLQLLAGLLTVAVLFPFYGRSRRWRAVQRWSAGICRRVDLQLRVAGALPSGERAVLLVANHVSWLDIQVIHSICAVRFVAKSEVRGWPALGWLAARTGTLFVHRGRHRHAAEINQAIHAAFASGDRIGVFPEGTTTDGRYLLRFHASLLQPAVDEGALVVPLALRYTDAQGKIDVAPSYIGERTLLESALAVIAAPQLRAELRFLPAIDARGRTRRELALAAQGAIASALELPVIGTAPGRSSGLPDESPTDGRPTRSPCPAPED
jgi:1-acyl-sn-glycerol-3-phosphate acyltransferase